MTGPRYRIESFYLLHFDSIIVHKQQTRVIPGLLHVGSLSLSLSFSFSLSPPLSLSCTQIFILYWLVPECLDVVAAKEIPNWRWVRNFERNILQRKDVKKYQFTLIHCHKNERRRRKGNGMCEQVLLCDIEWELMGNLIFSLSCNAKKTIYEESIWHCVECWIRQRYLNHSCWDSHIWCCQHPYSSLYFFLFFFSSVHIQQFGYCSISLCVDAAWYAYERAVEWMSDILHTLRPVKVVNSRWKGNKKLVR